MTSIDWDKVFEYDILLNKKYELFFVSYKINNKKFSIARRSPFQIETLIILQKIKLDNDANIIYDNTEYTFNKDDFNKQQFKKIGYLNVNSRSLSDNIISDHIIPALELQRKLDNIDPERKLGISSLLRKQERNGIGGKKITKKNKKNIRKEKKLKKNKTKSLRNIKQKTN